MILWSSIDKTSLQLDQKQLSKRMRAAFHPWGQTAEPGSHERGQLYIMGNDHTVRAAPYSAKTGCADANKKGFTGLSASKKMSHFLNSISTVYLLKLTVNSFLMYSNFLHWHSDIIILVVLLKSLWGDNNFLLKTKSQHIQKILKN